MTPVELARALKEEARARGFVLAGIAAADPSEHLGRYRAWIAEGMHGEMGYLARPDAVRRRGDLTATLERVRSVLVVADAYAQDDPPGVPGDPSRGVIARYARGRDYHKVLKKKLVALARWLQERSPGVEARAYVDTGPILERELARRAGLGWFGKNTMLLNPGQGSYFFLGLLLLDIALPPDAPFEADRCGTCRACLDACPTGALLGRDETGAPVMDARRCIAYLTIEHRGPIPMELRPLVGNRVFGCDICQACCPFVQKFSVAVPHGDYAAPPPGETDLGPERGAGGVSAETSRAAGRAGAVIPPTDGPALVDLMRMSEDEWDAYTRGSAVRRAGYSGLRRNVAIALGNWLTSCDTPQPEAVALLRAALSDEDPVVVEAAAWALGRIGRRGREHLDARGG